MGSFIWAICRKFGLKQKKITYIINRMLRNNSVDIMSKAFTHCVEVSMLNS